MSKIKTVNQLTPDLLSELFTQDILAIRVPNYINTNLCDKLSHWFINDKALQCYHHDVVLDGQISYIDYGVDRLGVSYNTTFGKDLTSKEHQQYYENSLVTIQRVRQACGSELSPIDKFRLEMDENWAYGARIASFDHKNMTLGIGRVMNRPEKSHMTELQPHIDLLPPHIDVVAQYSANVYLSLPDSGGELELWDLPPVPMHEVKPDYDWRANYPNSILLTPEKGELIIINTRRPHAIRSFTAGSRVTQQCFIGLKKDKSIVLWS